MNRPARRDTASLPRSRQPLRQLPPYACPCTLPSSFVALERPAASNASRGIRASANCRPPTHLNKFISLQLFFGPPRLFFLSAWWKLKHDFGMPMAMLNGQGISTQDAHALSLVEPASLAITSVPHFQQHSTRTYISIYSRLSGRGSATFSIISRRRTTPATRVVAGTLHRLVPLILPHSLRSQRQGHWRQWVHLKIKRSSRVDSVQWFAVHFVP